jgi:hypothetical protein
MELQELVERIQRWKTRMETGSQDDAVTYEEETFADAVDANIGDSGATPNADELDFEEMDVAEIPDGDSGLLETEELESAEITKDDDEGDVGFEDDGEIDTFDDENETEMNEEEEIKA